MLSDPDKDLDMLDAMSGIVRLAAGPRRPGDTVESMIHRAARRLPFLSERRVQSFWRKERTCRVHADEAWRMWQVRLRLLDEELARTEAEQRKLREDLHATRRLLLANHRSASDIGPGGMDAFGGDGGDLGWASSHSGG